MATMARRLSSALCQTIVKLDGLSISNQVVKRPVIYHYAVTNCFRSTHPSVSFHTSVSLRGLEEFFDDKKNWGEQEVKVGRSWKVEELRIKSNEDLHKLWFVLLKEKNMLLTMEHACKEECRLFPNPERIDKVQDSMDNLERVVRERNRAYYLLETGETGERPWGPTTDPLGRKFNMQYSEHFVPVHMNARTNKKHIHRGAAVVKFQRLMREKAFLQRKKYYNRVHNHVCHLLRRFPSMDDEAVLQQYPDVKLDMAQLRKKKRSLGHHLNNEG